jgi:hypothetical protein
MNKLVTDERSHAHTSEESKEFVMIDKSPQKSTNSSPFELDLE